MTRDEALVEELFKAATELPPDRRERFLDERCGDDSGLRREVETLLRSRDEIPAGFLAGRGPDRWEPESPGTVIGRYRILAKIGEGGMGAVYEAEQDEPRRRVALKVIRPGMGTPELLWRFHYEAQVLGQLQHPGIAQIYEAGTAEVETVDGARLARPFFAMELVEGERLDGYAARHGLDLRERLELVARVCDAVQHAHQKGVVHRDLKPENVLVVDKEVATSSTHASAPAMPRVGQPKILDFGVARATDVDLRSMRTQAGRLVGTLAYMSPEQAEGDPRRLDTRSDVYSLGVILYELLTGRLPLDVSRCSAPEAVHRLRNEEPPRPSSIDRDLRGDVETIVRRAIQKDPSRRYATASDLAADIRRYLCTLPIEAKRDSTLYVIRKAVRRRPGLAASIATLALVLLAFGTVSAVQVAEQRRLNEELKVANADAERRAREMRQLAQNLMVDVYDEVRSVPGATRARKELIDVSLDYLGGLEEEARNDPSLRLDLAVGYLRAGDVLGDPGGPNLGDQPAAIESYERAIELLDDLLEDEPNHRAALLDRTWASLKLAVLRSDVESHEVLVELNERARRDAERLLEMDPTSEDHVAVAVHAQVDLGLRRTMQGRREEGLELCRTAEQRLLGFLETHGTSARLVGLREKVLEGLCLALRLSGDREGLRARVEEWRAHHQRHGPRGTHDLERRIDSVRHHLILGTHLKTLEDLDEALAEFEAGYAEAMALLQDDPLDVQARALAASLMTYQGDAARAVGNLELARDRYLTALESARSLVAEHPDHLTGRRDLAIIHEKIGLMGENGVGELAEALDHFERARTIREALLEGGDTAFTVRGIAVACYHAGVVREMLGEAAEPFRKRELLQEALRDFEDGKAVLERTGMGLEHADLLQGKIDGCRAALDEL